MKPRRLARRLLLASFVIIVPLAFLAARGLESEASVRARVGSILATLPTLSDCSSQCTTSDCEGSDHENHAGGTTHGGSRHGCAYNPGGCARHQEFCTKDAPPIGQLQKLIPSLDGEGIRYFVRSTEAFTLNLDRRAVQVLGCGGNVILSLNLTPTQELDMALDN